MRNLLLKYMKLKVLYIFFPVHREGGKFCFDDDDAAAARTCCSSSSTDRSFSASIKTCDRFLFTICDLIQTGHDIDATRNQVPKAQFDATNTFAICKQAADYNNSEYFQIDNEIKETYVSYNIEVFQQPHQLLYHSL